jgi:hypothetical protein
MKKIQKIYWKSYLDKIYDPVALRLKLIHSRRKARSIINMVRVERGRTVVSRAMLREIKDYARENFGSTEYWPWLVCYSEIRGEFIKGWVPDDFYQYKLLRAINPVTLCYVSFIKSFDRQLFGDFAHPFIVFKANDTLFDNNRNVIDVETALARIRDSGNEIVLKRESGFGGRDIHFLNSSDVTREMLARKFDYIIQEVAIQHESINAVYPGSINTIRVMTFLGFDSKVRVMFAKMRIGGAGSRIDNMRTGGRAIFFDDSGNCVSDAHNEIGLEVENRHPQTGFEYRKLSLPYLEAALEKCVESHYRYPYIRLIAWDVFIDREGKPVLLEWNSKSPGIWVNECLIGPLWDNQVQDLCRRL